MTLSLDDAAAGQDLTQFEPDPDGMGSREGCPPAGGVAAETAGDDLQWVVWLDAAREAAWAAGALMVDWHTAARRTAGAGRR
jgi:hypothetical protein